VVSPDARDVVLGRGLIDDTGRRHRTARLRPLTGWQEATLAGASGGAGAPELLVGSVAAIGSYIDVDASLLAALSRGDLALLALELRASLFGPRLVLTLRCPNPECRELADLDLDTADLLPERAVAEPEWIEAATPDGAALVRTPTGADDAAVAAVGGDRDERVALLFSRLVGRLGDRAELTPEQWRDLAPASRHAIALAVADGEVAPTLAITSRCPACRAGLELSLDPFDLLGRELRLGAGRLLVEVHCLAYHYSWSEDEILSLPRTRRWRYLELLRNQIEGLPLESSMGGGGG
jgi:hypothetical protein